MRLVLVAAIVLVFVSWATTIGLILQNSKQKTRIKELESQLQTNTLAFDQLKKQSEVTGDIQKKNAALEVEIARQITLIESMRKQLPGATQLPTELGSMLEKWVRDSNIATFDPNRAVVKLKSNSLFKAGSDGVEPSATEAIKGLCQILNTEQAKEFDIIIAGHTDNQPILNPGTLAKHPTNLHLSVHRAISVLNIMTGNGIAPERINVRGFGEYRPIVPNEPNMMAGTPQNRRIEINIVPMGV